MRVLVTGGAGFIGSHVTEALLEAGARVAVVDNLSTGCRQNVSAEAVFYEADITAPDLGDIFTFEKPEVVVHLAAQAVAPVSLARPCFDASVNITGTINLLEASRRAGVRRVVYSSSAAVYGAPVYLPVDEAHPVQPISPYGASKYAAEVYLAAYRRLYGIEWAALRLANVYGPRQDAAGEGGVVAVFCRRLREGAPPGVFGDGEQTRDFIYVKDVAAAVLAALKSGGGEALNIGTGKGTSVKELLQVLERISEQKVLPRYGPPRPGDIRHSVLDPARARAVLTWQSRYSLVEGLKQTYYAAEETPNAK
ncbi:MAG: NAD-dependent epimerase/dehydratase family protein [Ammonifex sp.]|jgi:UDP-glucose 4-epimerase|nr:MAG: NAD-dependent epimerase/dehydratase family protein [Ammonifex sp.]